MADEITQPTTADYESEELGVKLSIPLALSDKLYMSYMGYVRQGQKTPALEYESNWLGARILITTWECEKIPDIWKDNLNSVTPGGMTRTRIRQWVGNTVYAHIAGIQSAEKNE